MVNLIIKSWEFIVKGWKNINIIWRFIIKNPSIIFRSMAIVLMISILASNNFMSAESAELLGSSLNKLFSDYRSFLSTATAGIAISLAIFGLRQITTRSHYERANKELLSSINLTKKELLIQIERSENNTDKEELKQQILELRNKYQLLSGKILQNKDGDFVEDWRSVLLSTRKRLLDEEDRLLTRNKRNLGIGVLMIVVGIIFLMYATGFFEQSLEGNIRQASNSNTGKDSEGINIWNFLANYGPIFSILVLIEIPTFFFLSLYASNERKIERNKNDLTNIELRLTAGLMLYDKANGAKFAVLSDTLSKEESNVVLGKNESSGGGGTNKLLETLLKITPKGGG